MNALLDDLRWRGLIAQSTDIDELGAMLDAGMVTLYCGFDPTAPSLHVGNLVPLLTLRRFQQAGHRPIALVGGATGLIGDPSGRTSERTMQSSAVVEEWVELIRAQVTAFLDFEAPGNAAVVVSNLDWTADVTAIEFLRDVGKHFSVNQMLAKESVSTRLSGEGLSYTEFSYMVLQAFDFHRLYLDHQCRMQIGGSDQWGNITAGLDLIRRMNAADDLPPGEAPTAGGLTVPLVTKSDGTKFGKTAGGAIWLDAERTSPYAFHQFWLNTDDGDIANFVKLFSFAPREEIEQLLADSAEKPGLRLAQRFLADELTTLVHGQAQALQARAAGQALFGTGDLKQLESATLTAALTETGHVSISAADLASMSLVDLLVESGLCASKAEARRTITSGGAYVNNDRIEDLDWSPSTPDMLDGGWVVLRRGKRSVAGVRVVP